MSKNKKDTLNDLNEFLKHTQGTKTPKSQGQSTKNKNQPKDYPQNQAPNALPLNGNDHTKKSKASEQDASSRLSEEKLLDFIKQIAEDRKTSPERVLADLLKKNSAEHTFHNFLLTDLMVKGSFLMFNFWLMMQESQNDLINLNFGSKDKEDKEEE